MADNEGTMNMWPKMFNISGVRDDVRKLLRKTLDRHGSIYVMDLYAIFGGAPDDYQEFYEKSGWKSMSAFSFEDNFLTVQEPTEIKMGEVPKTVVDLKLIEGQTRTTFEFTSDNVNWSNHDGHNEFFLSAMVKQYNNHLQHYHYVFLNQFLRGLAINETAYGQVAGWSANGDGEVLMSIEKLVGDDSKLLLHFKRVKVIVLELGD